MTFNRHSFIAVIAGLCSVTLVACTSTPISDPKEAVDNASHCEDGEFVDDSSVAVLPIPVVAFFVPHADINDIQADEYVRRCGDNDRLANREVVISRIGCLPAGLTRIVTLGIWQWCPAYVSWEADVKE